MLVDREEHAQSTVCFGGLADVNLDADLVFIFSDIVNTRGTMEMQGPSIAFRGCNSQLQEKVPGGTEYNTEYPAGVMQMSGSGTDDVSVYRYSRCD